MKYILITLLLTVSGPVCARTFTPNQIALLAEERAPLIKMQLEGKSAATFQISQAKLIANPILSVQTGNLKAGTQSGSVVDVTLGQPIPWPGKRFAEINSAKILEKISDVDVEESKLLVHHSVSLLSLELAILNELAKHNNERKHRFSIINKFLTTRPMASPKQVIEKNLIQTQILLVESQMYDLETKKKSISAQLAQLSGEEDVAISLNWNNIQDVHSKGAFLDLLENNPRYKKSLRFEELAQNRIEQARFQARPDIVLGLNYRQENVSPVNHLYHANVSVVIPIIDRGQHLIEVARANARKEEANKKLVMMDSLNLLNRSYQALISAYRSTQLFKVSDLQKIETRFRAAEDAFLKGRIDVTTFLQTDTQIHDSIDLAYMSFIKYYTALSDVKMLTGAEDGNTMNTFLTLILKSKSSILFILIAIMLWGLWGIKDMAIDAVPDITNVQVVVNVKTNALDPENIELQITRSLEIELSGVPNLTDMRSISKFGLAQVTLVFEEGTDLYWARQQVSERIGAVNLPEGVTIELAPITTGLGEVYMYTLITTPESPLHMASQKERLTELRTIQDYTVKPHLKKISGVADVDSNGGYVKQIHINFFPDKMDTFGITIQHLLTKLRLIGVSAGGGYIQTSREQVIVRTYPVMSSLETISQLSLGVSPSGRPIRLSDVAEVRADHSLRVGAATHAGHEAVLGTVLMRVGSNGRKVVEGVEASLKELRLPKGIQIKPLYTRKYLVDNTIKTVSTSLIEGAILVILVLLILLGNIKAALIVTLAIPISMIVALKGMNLLGITGNLMSLGAIDFGLLVDGSVVVIESILAKMVLDRVHAKNPASRVELIKQTCVEVMPPVIAGLLLIMAVYIPILTLEGVEGKMFKPMALTVLMALGASLLTALIIMPILAEMFLKIDPHGDEDHDTWFFKKIKFLFVPMFEFFLKKPLPLFGGAALLLGLSFLILTQLGSDFVPELDEGDLVLGVTRSARISIDASVEEQGRVEEILKKFSEVTEVFARLGTPESATDPMGVNLADTFLILEKDRSKWRFGSKDELTAAMIKELKAAFPEADVSSTQPIGMRFNEMLEGSRADISLRIYGEDLKSLYQYGEKAKDIISPIRGVESIEQDPLTALRQGPVLDIKPDFNKLGMYGLTLEEVNDIVGLSLAGIELGSFIQNNVKYPIVLHLDEKLRDNPDEIVKLPIELPMGGTIPLNKVADTSLEEKVTTIARQWGKRYAAISINISGRDIGSLVEESKQKIQEGLGLLPGYELSWGGQFKNLERANARLMLIVPLTLLGVFLILLKVFGSLAPTLLVFSSVPFAGVGGVFALYLRDINFSVSAGVGFIALIGIALLNSLVLMTVLLKESEVRPIEEAVRGGTISRLRPVLMTALVAGLGFIPMALNTGIGAEVQRPLATVVIGGLVSSTILTLFLLPSAFLYWYKNKG